MPNSAGALAGALRGPLLLISLGILLLVQRFADVSFGKTWPILLIVFGAMKLLERMLTRTPSGLDGMTGGSLS